MPKLNIDRATLAKFLPDHKTIVAFEKLLEFASTTDLDSIEDLLALVSGIKRLNGTLINNRLGDLEASPAQRPNLSGINTSIAELQALQPRSENLSSLEKRVEALELERQRLNLDPLTKRVENLENIVGV